MERESRKIAEALLQKPLSRNKNSSRNSGASNDFPQVESCDDISFAEKKNSLNRYRINSPKGKKESKDLLMNFSAAVQSSNEHFKHLKFDTKNSEVYPRSNRNRLPQIPHFQVNFRTSSLENRF